MEKSLDIYVKVKKRFLSDRLERI